MRERYPFRPADLEELDEKLLAPAKRVVPMWDVACGDTEAGVIGLRHDVDDNRGSFHTALHMARWECERGYSSTYYLLHGSHYWDDEMLCLVPEFEELGHEVGIHVNALAVALRENRRPHEVLREALAELRSAGVRVRGCVAHGDGLCHAVGFVNDEIFTESPRPDWGAPERILKYQGVGIRLYPKSRSEYELAYDASWLPRADYLSDSGGVWSQSFEGVAARAGAGQLHVLIHPDWWTKAFVREEVAG